MMSKTQFPNQQERLKSLQPWKPGFAKEYKYLENIASAGFSYFNESDDPGRLRCVYCRLPVSNWKPNDDPWEVHISSANKICPYIKRVKGMDFIRSKLDGSGENVNNAALNQETHLLVGLQNSASANEQHAGEHRNVRTENVPRCDMADAEKRNESFEEAANHLEVLRSKRNELVKSGFFFEGLGQKGDSVRCYSCSRTMWDIRKEDDIWKEHAQMFTCNHVINMKGLEFVLAATITSSNNNKRVLHSDADIGNEGMVTEDGERYKRRSTIIDQQEEREDIGNEGMVTENGERYKRRSTIIDQQEEREGSSSDNGAWHKRRCTRPIQCKSHQEEETGMETDGISSKLGGIPNIPSRWEMPDTELRNAVKFKRRRRIPSWYGRDSPEEEKMVYLCCCAIERRDRGAMPCPKCGKNLHL